VEKIPTGPVEIAEGGNPRAKAVIAALQATRARLAKGSRKGRDNPSWHLRKRASVPLPNHGRHPGSRRQSKPVVRATETPVGMGTETLVGMGTEMVRATETPVGMGTVRATETQVGMGTETLVGMGTEMVRATEMVKATEMVRATETLAATAATAGMKVNPATTTRVVRKKAAPRMRAGMKERETTEQSSRHNMRKLRIVPLTGQSNRLKA